MTFVHLWPKVEKKVAAASVTVFRRHMIYIVSSISYHQISYRCPQNRYKMVYTCHGCDITVRYLPECPANFPDVPEQKKRAAALPHSAVVCWRVSVFIIRSLKSERWRGEWRGKKGRRFVCNTENRRSFSWKWNNDGVVFKEDVEGWSRWKSEGIQTLICVLLVLCYKCKIRMV